MYRYELHTIEGIAISKILSALFGKYYVAGMNVSSDEGGGTVTIGSGIAVYFDPLFVFELREETDFDVDGMLDDDGKYVLAIDVNTTNFVVIKPIDNDRWPQYDAVIPLAILDVVDGYINKVMDSYGPWKVNRTSKNKAVTISGFIPDETYNQSKGYDKGSLIFCLATNSLFICVDSAPDGATWQEVTPTPTSIDAGNSTTSYDRDF